MTTVKTRRGIVRPRSYRRHMGAHLTAIVACIVWAFPVYWMVNTSFKTTPNITTTVPQFFPEPFTLENYVNVFTKPNFLTSLRNSLLIALAVVVLSIVFGFLASTALTKFNFRGRKLILVFILGVQMVPGTALLIPLFLTFKGAGLLNSFLGLGLAYVATVLPFSIWILRGFFYSIPLDIEEAARVDGASTPRVLWSIYLPLLLPGLIATSVFAFIAAWNDYITALVFMKDQAKYTLPIWLVSFNTEIGTDYGGLIAGSVIFALPVAVFFMIIQRNLVQGMSAGAVKG